MMLKSVALFSSDWSCSSVQKLKAESTQDVNGENINLKAEETWGIKKVKKKQTEWWNVCFRLEF